MAQYLNAELVHSKTHEIISFFSCSMRLRDMVRDHDVFDNTFQYKDNLPFETNYKGDEYEGVVTYAKIESALSAKKAEVEKWKKKKEHSENLICKAENDKAYSLIMDDVRMYDELIEEASYDVEAIEFLKSIIVYECEFKDERQMKDCDDMGNKHPDGPRLGYPESRMIPLEDIEVHFWLNI